MVVKGVCVEGGGGGSFVDFKITVCFYITPFLARLKNILCKLTTSLYDD